MIHFTKMHGLGNDYIYINALKEAPRKPGDLAKKMSDRHFGVGGDGLILILPAEQEGDFRMRMFNADGSEAEMCGNGIRAFGKYVYDYGLTKNKNLTIETLAGLIGLDMKIKNKKVTGVTVDMGEPVLQRERIPMIGDPGMVIDEHLHLDDGVRFPITAVSMGNPHAVVFVEDVEHFPVAKYGPMIENHDLFPNKTNVEFVELISEKEVSQRTWERGTGETLACGTGASAVTVAGWLTKRTDRSITIHLRGGDLHTEWRESDNHLYMTGPAVEVFSGQWPGDY